MDSSCECGDADGVCTYIAMEEDGLCDECREGNHEGHEGEE